MTQKKIFFRLPSEKHVAIDLDKSLCYESGGGRAHLQC